MTLAEIGFFIPSIHSQGRVVPSMGKKVLYDASKSLGPEVDPVAAVTIGGDPAGKNGST